MPDIIVGSGNLRRGEGADNPFHFQKWGYISIPSPHLLGRTQAEFISAGNYCFMFFSWSSSVGVGLKVMGVVPLDLLS